jgi:CelD/BcsL family acetyltransferase involved in cellulose biosynthesis
VLTELQQIELTLHCCQFAWQLKRGRHSTYQGWNFVRRTGATSVLQDVGVRAVEGFGGLSAKERLAWNALFATQSDGVPFQSLSWNEDWWEVFGRPSRFWAKEALILVLSRHDEIIAFFPLFRVTLSVLGIPLLRHVKPMGSDPNLTEVKLGVVRAGHERDAYTALVEYFRRVDRRWEFATLPAVAAGVAGDGGLALIEHPAKPLIEGFSIALEPSWDAFRGGLKRNVKEAIRKCLNSLKRDGVEPVFTCLSDAAAIKELLPDFYRLHGMRAKEQDGVFHPDYFQMQEARSFIERLASDPAKTGIRLFVLKDGGRLIAARLAFETPRGTYLYYSGYDLEYGKYSIMTRLVVEVLKQAIERGQQEVHLSFGRDVSKTRWSPREVVYEQYLIIRNSLRGWLFGALYRTILTQRRKRMPASGGAPLPPLAKTSAAETKEGA